MLTGYPVPVVQGRTLSWPGGAACSRARSSLFFAPLSLLFRSSFAPLSLLFASLPSACAWARLRHSARSSVQLGLLDLKLNPPPRPVYSSPITRIPPQSIPRESLECPPGVPGVPESVGWGCSHCECLEPRLQAPQIFVREDSVSGLNCKAGAAPKAIKAQGRAHSKTSIAALHLTRRVPSNAPRRRLT